jgi:hypothetical protein
LCCDLGTHVKTRSQPSTCVLDLPLMTAQHEAGLYNKLLCLTRTLSPIVLPLENLRDDMLDLIARTGSEV